MSPPLVSTAITIGGLAHARALARSVARLHPGDQLHVLLLGDATRESVADKNIVFLGLAELDIDENRVHQLAGCVSGADLAAALAPDVVAGLLKIHPDRLVAYVDVEVVLLEPLQDLGEVASQSGVALIPFLLDAEPRDGLTPGLLESAGRGAINPGIVVVAPRAAAFCPRWSELVMAQAVQENSQIARSQPFMDTLLVGEHVQLVRDPGHGVGYWNAHERGIVLEAEESPSAPLLRSVHLAGFDPKKPYLLSTESGARPRVLLSNSDRLAAICAQHAEALEREGMGRDARVDPFQVLENGDPFNARMRRIYRRELRSVDLGDGCGPMPPDPFSDVIAFYDWICTGDPRALEAPMLPRYLGEIWRDRKDLMWHFPRVGSIDALRFREWVENHGLAEESVPTQLRSALARSRWWSSPQGLQIAPAEELRDGAVIVGFLRAESGIGEAARLLQLACSQAGVDAKTAPLRSPSSREAVHVVDIGNADRRINFLWVNAEQVPHVAAVLGPSFFEGRYTIGGWYWESEHLPDRFASSAEFLDEIWVPSQYVKDAVLAKVNCPVYVFPHPIVVPKIDSNFTAASLGAGRHPLFLFTYDMLSSFVRKNPLGVFEAFSHAFPEGSGPMLLLKSVNGDKRPSELEKLRIATKYRSDVVVYDGYLSPHENAALIAQCDCYVSLHRAEGLGLGIAEAMTMARPVIATKYSGNLDFMDDTCAFLVPMRLITVGDEAPPYEPNDRWADPDLPTAIRFMRSIVDDLNEARRVGSVARERMLSFEWQERSTQFVRNRVAQISEKLRNGYTSSIPHDAWANL